MGFSIKLLIKSYKRSSKISQVGTGKSKTNWGGSVNEIESEFLKSNFVISVIKSVQNVIFHFELFECSKESSEIRFSFTNPGQGNRKQICEAGKVSQLKETQSRKQIEAVL
jgi:hypothetical protein